MAWSRESRHARGYGTEWVKLRAKVLERDLYLCQYCLDEGRTRQATEVDHVIPKAKGGEDTMENCASACQSCHAAKTARENGKLPPRQLRRVGLDGYPAEDDNSNA